MSIKYVDGYHGRLPAGITVRQFYKAIAMQALITRQTSEMSHEECVRWASEYADEMIAEDKEHQERIETDGNETLHVPSTGQVD